MRKMNTYIPVFFLVLIISLSSCQEVIQIDLNSADRVLVAEGYMEKDSLCRISLSYTTDYFQTEIPAAERNAVVILSNDFGESETLIHMGDGLYRGEQMRGVEYAKYTLSIETEDQVNAGFSSLMPTPVFDSVRMEDFPFAGSHPSEDFPKMLIISFQSIPGQGSYFMLKTGLNGKAMENYFVLASNEYSTSAETVEYTTMFFPSGDGDTLSMEVYAIDKDTYRYYSQINEAISGGMAMSATPYNPASNLGEDILGYFMARSRFDTTLVIR